LENDQKKNNENKNGQMKDGKYGSYKTPSLNREILNLIDEDDCIRKLYYLY